MVDRRGGCRLTRRCGLRLALNIGGGVHARIASVVVLRAGDDRGFARGRGDRPGQAGDGDPVPGDDRQGDRELHHAQTTALRKCWDAVVVGKQVAACPDAKGQNVIAKAKAKLDALVNKACGGADKICGTDTAPDIALGVIGWNIGTAPEATSATIRSPMHRHRCLRRLRRRPGGRTELRSLLSAGRPSGRRQAAPKVRSRVRQEQRDRALHAGTRLRQSLARRPTSRSRGASSAVRRQVINAIAKAKGKHVAAVCNACGGGRACGGGFAPASLGFPLQCPAIGACGGPVQTMREAASCVDCVAGVVTDGAARISIPAFTSPPPQCLVLP